MAIFAPQLLNPSLYFCESFQECKQNWYAHKFSTLGTGNFLVSMPQGVKWVKNSPKIAIIAKNGNFAPQFLNPSLNFSESFQKRKQLWYAHECSIIVIVTSTFQLKLWFQLWSLHWRFLFCKNLSEFLTHYLLSSSFLASQATILTFCIINK